jgi:geranylgeranyl diphosphate synthase type I
MPSPVWLGRQSSTMLPAIEGELRRQIHRMDTASMGPLHQMLEYHMGWSEAHGTPSGRGKRLRPLITLLVCRAVGGRWQSALPAAAALEIVHNFSLVHDDIQDNSPTRRGRPTLWKVYGMPLAINAGDALLTIANLAILDLPRSTPSRTVTQVAQILQEACLDLTRGQHLDLSHKEQRRLTLRAYWSMVDGKTAALISACSQIGAALGGAGRPAQLRYRSFGRLLGAAFQVQDDILGIWGDETITGKSAATDLLEGKLSLPVVYALRREGRFAREWSSSRRRPSQVAALRSMLEAEGALAYSVRQAKRLTRAAFAELHGLHPQGPAGRALDELVHQLLYRRA